MEPLQRVLAVVLVAGCGDDGGTNTPRYVAVDASPDAPPDVLIDAPLPPLGHHHYVIDRLLVPQSNNQARMYGLDLNGDATVDNQLGMVLGTLSSVGFDGQAAADAAIDRGTSIVLLDLATLDFVNDTAASAALFKGTSSMPAACSGGGDTVCRKHLTGSATFVVAATPVHPPLTGAFASGTFDGGPGTLSVPLTFAAADPIDLTLIGARIRIASASAGAIGTAIIAGAVPEAEISTKIIPGLGAAFRARVTADCTMLANPPTCGCASGSEGKTLLDLFDDAPKDCAITDAEVASNALMQSLLAPDVMINGVSALSVGLGATAVPGGFVTP